MRAGIRSEAPLIAAAATAAAMYTVGDGWFDDLGNGPLVAGLLVWIFVVMLWASRAPRGYLRQAFA